MSHGGHASSIRVKKTGNDFRQSTVRDPTLPPLQIFSFEPIFLRPYPCPYQICHIFIVTAGFQSPLLYWEPLSLFYLLLDRTNFAYIFNLA